MVNFAARMRDNRDMSPSPPLQRAEAAASLPLGQPGAHPTIDVLTEHRAILIEQAPVLGLSASISDVIARARDGGVVLTLITPPDTRLTLPLRMLASEGLLFWAVRTESGQYYDGLRGYCLTFDGGQFFYESVRADAFDVPLAPEAWQVVISASVEHRASAHTRLGGVLEVLCRELTGSRPAGWGLHEAISEPWNRDALTAVARRRMPGDTRLLAVGAHASMIASTVASRTERGVEEVVDCLINVGPLTRPIEDVATAVRSALRTAAAQEIIGYAIARLRPGRADLTEPARVRALPIALAIVVGPRAVKALGRERFLRPGMPRAVEVGRPRVPGLLVELGRDGADGWKQLSYLVDELGPQRLRAVAPGFDEQLTPDGPAASTAPPLPAAPISPRPPSTLPASTSAASLGRRVPQPATFAAEKGDGHGA